MALEQMTDQQRIARGRRAKSLVHHEAFAEAYKEIHSNLHGGLDRMRVNDTKVMGDIVSQLRALRTLKDKWHQWVDEADRLIRNGADD